MNNGMKLACPASYAKIHPGESSTINTQRSRRLTRPGSEFGSTHGCLSPGVKTPNTHVVVRLVNGGGKVSFTKDLNDKRIRMRLPEFLHRFCRHPLIFRCFQFPWHSLLVRGGCGNHPKNHHRENHRNRGHYQASDQDGFRHGHVKNYSTIPTPT